MKLLDKFFKKEFATCSICDKKLYKGDYYGYEHDHNSLSITGYFDYYFCASCIERNCTSEKINAGSLGKSFIISRKNRERSRITIKC